MSLRRRQPLLAEAVSAERAALNPSSWQRSRFEEAVAYAKTV